ncbi:hypothetical protein CDAR_459361 [Caerostris darwini]|uniref:Uncharacterized protein n=1 Tax=Caerostris darwini TaxID=1538125 RepID=A0AAV4UE18_9ARAC|nr:hypothetical protein CDAR_459361 [Caerostris darwini]
MRTNQSVTIHRIPPVTVILIPSVCKVSIPRCPTNPVIEATESKANKALLPISKSVVVCDEEKELNLFSILFFNGHLCGRINVPSWRFSNSEFWDSKTSRIIERTSSTSPFANQVTSPIRQRKKSPILGIKKSFTLNILASFLHQKKYTMIGQKETR